MKKIVGIYTIRNTVNHKCYIGSSIDISRRWSEHKRRFNYILSPLYNDIREFGLECFQFSILEECTVDELKELEQYYIDAMKPEYNRCNANAGISVRFSEDAKAYKKEYCRQYQQAHKSEINERNRKYYESHKSEISEDAKAYKKAYNRNYYQSNKSEISERNRKYYESHKSEISERRRKHRQAKKQSN